MTNEEQTSLGLMSWLAQQFGAIQHALGELHQGQVANRQTALGIRRELMDRIDHLEAHIFKNGNGRRQYGWMKHIPWFKLALLTAATLLLITGHLTLADIKPWLLSRVQSF